MRSVHESKMAILSLLDRVWHHKRIQRMHERLAFLMAPIEWFQASRSGLEYDLPNHCSHWGDITPSNDDEDTTKP